jgi:hypothetical protein
MTKSDLLETAKLLSALESWSYSTGNPLPDYLQDALCDTAEKLRKEILEEPHEPTTS